MVVQHRPRRKDRRNVDPERLAQAEPIATEPLSRRQAARPTSTRCSLKQKSTQEQSSCARWHKFGVDPNVPRQLELVRKGHPTPGLKIQHPRQLGCQGR